MAGFKRTLSQPQGISTLVPPVEKTSEEANNLTLISQTLKGGFQIQDSLTKAELGQDLEEVNRQETIFQDEADQLRSQILSPNDQKQIDDVNDKLTRLERGRQAGKLTPAEASIRRNTLIKQAMNANPWIASELRSAASIYGGAGGRGTTAQQSPEERALDEFREESVRSGVPLTEVMARSNLKAQSDTIQDQVNLAAAQGKLTFDQFRAQVNRVVNVDQADIQTQMFSILKANPTSLDETDWIAVINNAKDTMVDKIIAAQAAYSKNNAIFGDQERKTIIADVDRSYKFLTDFAKSKDKIKLLEKKQKMVGLIGWEVMLEYNKEYATLFAMGEERALDLAFDIMPNAAAAALKHGGLEQLQIAADRGSTEALLTLTVARFQPALLARLAQEGLLKGTPARSPLDKLMQNSIGAGVLSKQYDGAPTKSAQLLQLNAVKAIADTSSSYEDLNFFLRPSILATIEGDPKQLKALDNRMELRESVILADIQESVRESEGKGRMFSDAIDFNVQEDKFFDVGKRDDPKGRAGSAPSNTGPLIENLNMVYNVNRLYGFFESRSKWIVNVVKFINKPAPEVVKEPDTTEELDTTLGGLDD